MKNGVKIAGVLMKTILLMMLLLYGNHLCGEKVTLSVNVVDDCGNPVSNAAIRVETDRYFGVGWNPRPNSYVIVSNKTDVTGNAVLSFKCITSTFECYVAAENYYPEANFHGRFRARQNKMLGIDFLDTFTNMSFVLKRKINPIPMYTYDNSKGIPGDNGYWGFDLQVGDWVSPFGTGKTADFNLEFQHKKIPGEFYECKGAIVFTNSLAGCYCMKTSDSSQMKTCYAVDTNAVFSARRSFHIRSDRKNPTMELYHPLLGKGEYLVLRTRTKVDSEGNIISANYSKIFGPIHVSGSDFEFRQITYNPNINDVNLESDPSRNLNRKSRGRGFP